MKPTCCVTDLCFRHMIFAGLCGDSDLCDSYDLWEKNEKTSTRDEASGH